MKQTDHLLPLQANMTSQRLLQAVLRQNLSAFTERSFNEVNSGKTYRHNWHLDALAWKLTQVADGKIKRLLITLPPRSLKSVSASVALPAWILGRRPETRIICASYGLDLAVDHANACRAIMKTPWYRQLFPQMQIDPRKDTETEFRTTRGGYRLSTTVGGSLTGRGGSIIIIDDPMKAADASSEAARNRVKTWFDETLLSRLDDKKDDAIILVMQRLHVDDLAGHVLSRGDWDHLDLPAVADREEIIQTGPYAFHERKIGELLQPEREPKHVLDELRASMGSAAFSAQYQQQPVPPGGNMIKWRWFATYSEPPASKEFSDKIVQSWDTASKATELADYSVCVTALVTRTSISILDVVRKRLEYPALKKLIIEQRKKWNADTVLIEDKGSGMSLIQDLKREGVYSIAIKVTEDKIVRMSACSAKIEAGSVFLPETASWLADFRNELLAFPQGRHDDQADALSQLINWTRTKSTYTLENIM